MSVFVEDVKNQKELVYQGLGTSLLGPRNRVKAGWWEGVVSFPDATRMSLSLLPEQDGKNRQDAAG